VAAFNILSLILKVYEVHKVIKKNIWRNKLKYLNV